MPLELSSYQKSLSIEALVLIELRAAGRITGDELVGRIEQVCESISARVEGFGFLEWSGTTVWGVLDSYVEGGVISHSGRRPHDPQQWRMATLQLEPSGERYLETIRRELPQLTRLLDQEVAPRAAAS